jgi:hypothetical protein
MSELLEPAKKLVSIGMYWPWNPSRNTLHDPVLVISKLLTIAIGSHFCMRTYVDEKSKMIWKFVLDYISNVYLTSWAENL